jgi:hypothetical protein
MNVNEWGVAFVFSTGFDMSSFTSISITFTKPDATTLVVTNPAVTVPNFDLVTTEGTFLANKYAKYIFVSGDVNQAGDWSAIVTYDDATPQHLISDRGTFTIETP